MRIGIDFDNTIICYDRVFNTVGVEKGLVPESLEIGKGFVRDYLRKMGKEKEWIWLQGYVYGSRLSNAEPYDGFHEFLDYCRESRIECVIISHKTIHPYSGDTYNLHDAAHEWIKARNFGIQTFFELTKENKIKRINDLGCSVFIDDLPEFLNLPGFSEDLFRILFDPLHHHAGSSNGIRYATSWKEILLMIKNGINIEKGR
jgi:hypothetical protein